MRSIPLAVCAALVLAACTGTDADGDGPGDVVATTTSSPTGSSTDPGPPPTPIRTIAWERIDDLEVFAGGSLTGIDLTDSGLVVVGTDELPQDAAVWVSDDGRAWTRVRSDSFAGTPDDSGVEGSQFMRDVIHTHLGTVAVGGGEFATRRDTDAAVWLSTGDTPWIRVDDPALAGPGTQTIVSVTEWNGVLFAAGTDDASGTVRPAVWSSADGTQWQRVASPAFDEPAVIEDLGATAGRIVAVGVSEVDPPQPAVWSSSDGVTWIRVDASDGAIEVSDPDEVSFMTSVASDGDGLIAVGATGTPSLGLTWRSVDGLAWQLVDSLGDEDRPGSAIIPFAVAATPLGRVAVGAGLVPGGFPALSFAHAWTSVSGTQWDQVRHDSTSTVALGPGAGWHIGSMRAVIGAGGGVIAVGSVPFQDAVLPGPFFRQAVWLGTWDD